MTAADQHVVQVRDDEVAIGLLQVDGRRGVHDARETADREEPHEPAAKWSALVARIEPPQSVASQLKIFTPVGIAISIVAIENAESATGAHAGREHVMAQTPKPRKPMSTPE